MGARRLPVGIAAAALVAGAGVGFASPASADQVWHQSVARAHADAPCPTNTPEESAAGWTEWAPSHATWANDGKGGFVCDRAITWAKDSAAAPYYGCLLVQTSVYVQFGSSDALPAGAPGFTDATCTTPLGRDSTLALVVADDITAAQVLCTAVAPGTTADVSRDADARVYYCLI
jgi:hypothetical protein